MMYGEQHKGAPLHIEDRHLIRHTAYVGLQVLIGQHHTLGRTRSARGIDDEGGLLQGRRGIGIGLEDHLCLNGLGALLHTGDGKHTYVDACLSNSLTRYGLRSGRYPDGIGTAILHDIGHVADSSCGIHRHGNVAVIPYREEGIDPLLIVFRENENLLLRSRRGDTIVKSPLHQHCVALDVLHQLRITHFVAGRDNRSLMEIFYRHSRCKVTAFLQHHNKIVLFFLRRQTRCSV